MGFEYLRIFNMATMAVALGIVGALAWRLRGRKTVPPYVKYVVVGYLPFAAFALATTQDAYRRDAPVGWITFIGTLAGTAGIAAGLWALRSARGQH